ncbi:gag-pol polyprotein [Salix suchowensis]|nr:gag-pol polyprotein [Salix suchowensis]
MDLWDAVEEDYAIPALANNPTLTQIKTHKELKTKKSKAKACLFAAVSATIFTRIMSHKSAKSIWDYLKEEYAGDERIRGMQRYEATITTLENTKDLSKISLAELLNSLQAQEQRRHMREEVNTEGALFAKHRHPPFKCWRRPDAKCAKCNQLGHEAVICKGKNQQQQQESAAQIAEEEDEDQLFVATCFVSETSTESWLIDSGCTNHMTNDKKLFKSLMPTEITKVKIGNGDYISVEGKGTITITSSSGVKLISDVLYVPEINQNLLSVGQLIERGLKVVFEDGVFGCVCFSHIPQVKRDKLDKKSEPGIFIGYCSSSKAYKVYQPKTRKIVVSRDVIFHEEQKWNWEPTSDTSSSKLISTSVLQPAEDEETDLEDEEPIRGTRLIQDIYQRCNVAVCEPADFFEAVKNEMWLKAMEEEMSMIEKNKTWVLVERPKNRKVMA